MRIYPSLEEVVFSTMTRKRLTKLLMARGVSRNQADLMAARYRRISMPYTMGYIDFRLEFNSASVEEFCREMRWLRTEVEKLTGEKYRTFMEMAAAMLRLSKKEQAS